MLIVPPVAPGLTAAPLPHVAVHCGPGCLAVRWLHDARGETRLTVIVRERHSAAPTPEPRIPANTHDVAQCVAFVAAVAGVARGDSAILGTAPAVVRIPVGVGSPPFLGVELTWANDGAFSVIAAEPSLRSPAATMQTLDAFIAAVAGEPDVIQPDLSMTTPPAHDVVTVSSDVAAAFAAVQRSDPAVISGVLPWMYRTALAYAVTGARVSSGA